MQLGPQNRFMQMINTIRNNPRTASSLVGATVALAGAGIMVSNPSAAMTEILGTTTVAGVEVGLAYLGGRGLINLAKRKLNDLRARNTENGEKEEESLVDNKAAKRAAKRARIEQEAAEIVSADQSEALYYTDKAQFDEVEGYEKALREHLASMFTATGVGGDDNRQTFEELAPCDDFQRFLQTATSTQQNENHDLDAPTPLAQEENEGGEKENDLTQVQPALLVQSAQSSEQGPSQNTTAQASVAPKGRVSLSSRRKGRNPWSRNK